MRGFASSGTILAHVHLDLTPLVHVGVKKFFKVEVGGGGALTHVKPDRVLFLINWQLCVDWSMLRTFGPKECEIPHLPFPEGK